MENVQMSTTREEIERVRALGDTIDGLKDHPSIKLIKQQLDESFQIPHGYNGITSGLEIPSNVDLIIPSGSTLVSV